MKISTIIPIYNSSKYLVRCLDSLVTAQIDKVDNEIILVNDGSTDNSLVICEQYANKNKNIKVFSQDNQGQSVARNLGIEKSVGEYITFVDSDDYVGNDYFEVINKYLNVKYDILIFGYYKVTNEVIAVRPFDIKTLDRESILYQISITSDSMDLFWYSVTKVYKSSLLSKLRFNSHIKIGEDTIFNIQAMANSYNVQIIRECLYYYVFNKNSLTGVKFRHSFLINMVAHYKARQTIHTSFHELQSKMFYTDISKYYINHILFWLLINIKHSPIDFNKFQELGNARNSIIYKECFQDYIYDWKRPKRSLIVKLFELKQYKLLFKVLKINA